MATAKDFTELVAWRRADELERFVQEIIRRPVLARDIDFCRQASDAAASAPRKRVAITDEEHWAGLLLCRRAIGAAVSLRRYLMTQQANANAKRIESNDRRK